VLPLFQYVQPIVHRASIKVVPQVSGYLLPQLVTG
jgi:peptide/nickel transport system substrate-binding protein